MLRTTLLLYAGVQQQVPSQGIVSQERHLMDRDLFSLKWWLQVIFDKILLCSVFCTLLQYNELANVKTCFFVQLQTRLK